MLKLNRTLRRLSAVGRTAGLLFAVSLAFGGQSLVLTPGKTGTFTIPNTAPFSSMGAYRMEMRIHDFVSPASSRTNLWWIQSLFDVMLQPGEVCVEDWQDDLNWGSRMCLSSVGHTDIVLRAQRNPDEKWFRFEMWDVATGNRTVRTCGPQGADCVIDKVKTASWAVPAQIGDANTTARIAWVKLSSTLLPLDSRPPLASDPADLWDWRFEGSLFDAVSYHINLSMSNATYAPTPNYPPVCNAGTQQSFRAGAPASLDGSGSYALDDGAGLQYRWVSSGPSEVSWDSSDAVVSPSISGLVFGTYVFQLTVEDQSGQKTACSVKHGAVATDEQGVVLVPDANVSKLLGPMIRLGASPWRWYDERHKTLADFFGSLQSTDYLDVWNIALSGTIAVTNNSRYVTGTGTAFKADFCGGGTASVNNPGMIIWYPVLGSPGRYGRRFYEVASCESDTEITLGRLYQTSGTTSGLSYSRMAGAETGTWFNGSTNANYYDNVMAFYALYYRSGIDTYLEYARTLADRWWTMPLIDEGRSCNDSIPGGVNCAAPRVRSYTGLALRALDGRPDMWDGLRLWWDSDQWGLAWTSPIGDIREEGLKLYNVALCALLDPNETHKASCAAALTTAIDQRWAPQQTSQRAWQVVSSGPASWNGQTGTINVTNGSTQVTGAGTNWDKSWFTPDTALWVTAGPTDNRNGESIWYKPTYVSPTEIKLDRPYEGPTATGRGWQFGDGVGWGTQPFMMGIVGTAFHYAYLATGDVRARQFVIDSANWIWNYGYRPSTKGLYYFRGFINCEPIAENMPACSADSLVASRAYTGEAHRTMALAYLYSKSSTLLAAGDTLFGATYGKLGGPNTDGQYDNELEGWTIGTKKAKDFGFHFGFGGGWAWPAARLGGAAPVATRPRRISIRPANVPGANGIRLKLTSPDGTTTESTCSSSPCTILEDPRQGDSVLRLEYRSADDKLMAAPSRQTVLKAR